MPSAAALLVLGFGGAFQGLDLMAMLDRRQAVLPLPAGVDPADHARDRACPAPGAARLLRGGAAALRALLAAGIPPGDTVLLLEEAGPAALALLLADASADRPALARIALADAAQCRAAALLDTGLALPGDTAPGPLAPEGLAVVSARARLGEAAPALSGLAQLVASIAGRRIPAAGDWGDAALAAAVDADPRPGRPVWPHFWVADPAGGRTGLALLEPGLLVAATTPPRPARDGIAGADLAPQAHGLAAADRPGLEAALQAVAQGGVAPPADWGPAPPAACQAVLIADTPAALARAALALHGRLADGATAPVDPVSGSCGVLAPLGAAPVAFVFPGFGSSHAGMLHRLTDGLPALGDYLESTFGAALPRMLPARTLYPPQGAVRGELHPLHGPPEEMAAAEILAHLTYGWIARHLLGLAPVAAIGVSLGGMAMVPVLGDDPAGLAEILLGPDGLVPAAGALIANTGGGSDDWAHGWALAAPTDLDAALAATPDARLLVRCEERLALVGGPRAAVTQLLARPRLHGRLTFAGMRHLHTPLIAPALAAARPAMEASFLKARRAGLRGIEIHVAGPPVRAGASVPAMAQLCRQLHESLLTPVDLPAMVRAAHRRGARVFIGCGGPGDTMGWISAILAGLPHLSIALAPKRMDPWRGLLSAARQLRAHGILPRDTPFDHAMRTPA